MKFILVTRVEQHQITKDHSMWKTIDDLCFKSKNLYNYANYIIRQEFINNGKWISYYDMKKDLKTHEPFKKLGSQPAQETLNLLDKNWKSFFKSIKDWAKNPSKYLGKPSLPKYKKKDGRNVLILSTNLFRIENDTIYFSWKPLNKFSFKIHTQVQGKLMQLRFIPKNNIYVMEIVYQTELPDIDENRESKRIASIDLGINNFATLTNNVGLKPIVINGKPLKAFNQYYNKKLAHYKSVLKKTNNKYWSKRLDSITVQRNNKINYYLHKASKYIIQWCKRNNIDTLVIGKNDGWKQESDLNKKVNQTFVQLPYERFITMLLYKGENEGIKVILTEEGYTSGTSFLDLEEPIKKYYNKKRRVYRGLFISNTGKPINADVNGALQIMKKVFPTIFNGIVGVHLHPIVVTV